MPPRATNCRKRAWSHQSIETKEEIEVVVQFVIIFKHFHPIFLSFTVFRGGWNRRRKERLLFLIFNLFHFYVITTFLLIVCDLNFNYICFKWDVKVSRLIVFFLGIYHLFFLTGKEWWRKELFNGNIYIIIKFHDNLLYFFVYLIKKRFHV